MVKPPSPGCSDDQLTLHEFVYIHLYIPSTALCALFESENISDPEREPAGAVSRISFEQDTDKIAAHPTIVKILSIFFIIIFLRND